MLSRITRYTPPPIPTDLSPIRSELKAIQDIMTLERSDPIIQIGQIDSLGGSVAPGVVDGVVDMSVKGRTGRNLIKDGNFPDGATKWFAGGGTLSIANNTATSTGNGVVLAPEIYQDTDIEAITGKEVFIRFKAKVTNAATPNIVVHLRGSISGNVYSVINQSSAIQNQEYTVYDIVTITSVLVGKIQLRILHAYADPAEANGKSMEVQEVLTKDLTAEGLTGETADEINTMFPDWFDGTQSAGPKRMKTVGKNLIKGESEQNNHLFNQGGGIWTHLNVWENGKLKVTDGSNNVHGRGVKLKTKIGEAYTIKCQAQDADDATARIIVGDNTGTGVKYGNYYPNAEVSFTFAADANEIIIRFIRAGLNNPDKPVYFWNIQLEEGAIATDREDYKQSLVYASEVGQSLPNGVADVVDVNEGIKIKNIEEDTTILKNATTWGVMQELTNTILFQKNLTGSLNHAIPSGGHGIVTGPLQVDNDNYPAEGSSDLWTVDIEGIGVNTAGTMNLRVDKSKLTTIDSAGLEAYLQSANQVIFHYQLAEPETIQLDIPSQSLLSFENGTLLQEHAIGEVTFYGANCPVSDTKYPIEQLDFIKKVNPSTGAMTDLDVSQAVIAADGLSFTHPDLSVGDLVDWDRYYSSELSTLAELSYTVPLANLKSTITRTQQVVTKTADYTVAADDYIILADGSTAAVNITLPTLLVAKNLNFKIKAVNITNAVKLITEGTETIDGAVDYTFSTANEVVEVVGDGVNWVMV